MSAAKAKKPPVLMIHGAFCGPWSLDGLKEKFEQAGYPVRAPWLRFHDESRRLRAGATRLLDYAADLEQKSRRWARRRCWWAIRWAAACWREMLAARVPVRALVLLAPSAPWGVRPRPCSRSSAAQALHLNPGYWNQGCWSPAATWRWPIRSTSCRVTA
ncbi:MAG: hypothetical protein H6924_10040 [Alphaproteobacteria bacterium]|nr:hypothetical protein [Alphaproteobacteria bacterium]